MLDIYAQRLDKSILNVVRLIKRRKIAYQTYSRTVAMTSGNLKIVLERNGNIRLEFVLRFLDTDK